MVTLFPLKAFSDNYIWVGQTTPLSFFCVDPGDPTAVLNYSKTHHQSLSHILITHHHTDHSGGISALQQAFPSVVVYAPKDSRLNQVTTAVNHGDTIAFDDLKFQVISTPGHTLTHLCYIEPKQGWLFCGDTLFSAGCGRQFEGTMKMLYDSIQLLKQLPENTQVFCGHEYTRSNLEFALTVEPENQDVQVYYQQLQPHACSLPSTIALERKINPFMRTTAKTMQHFASNEGLSLENPFDIFKRLREKKDSFTFTK